MNRRTRGAALGIGILSMLLLLVARNTGRHTSSFWKPNHSELERGSHLERKISNLPKNLCQSFHESVCKGPQKSINQVDPTGGLGGDLEAEFEALRMFEALATKYPDAPLSEIREELVKKIYTQKRVRQVERAFNWVRKELIKFIDTQPHDRVSADEKRLIKSHIRALKLELPPPADVYRDDLGLLTRTEVYFEKSENISPRLRIGGAFLLSVNNWFNLVFTVAHEFGHAIEPCELRNGGKMLPAYTGLISCFKDNQYFSSKVDTSRCPDDNPVMEIFADWIATQMTARALDQFGKEFHGPEVAAATINAVKDLCDFNDTDFTSHPDPVVRIEKLFGNHTTIRELLGCSPKAQAERYCTLGR